jgi:hypothetical protein
MASISGKIWQPLTKKGLFGAPLHYGACIYLTPKLLYLIWCRDEYRVDYLDSGIYTYTEYLGKVVGGVPVGRIENRGDSRPNTIRGSAGLLFM